MIYTFRFDDVSLNTDPKKLEKMIQFLRNTFKPKKLRIILAVSPAVFDMRECEKTLDRERTFPTIWHTESDHRIFYRMQRVGVPQCIAAHRCNGCELAAHGMVHVDHRLMDRAAQELSIVMSCSLLQCKVFVPPFHKWNQHTEQICTEHGITLVKYDPSWRHLVYHAFNHRNPNYYAHTHDFHYQDFCDRFPAENFRL
jgi:hypothetical protein